MYYDDKGRVVQTRSTNHLGGYDIVYNDLDFTGKPNKTLKEHNISGQAMISELYTYSYDHAGRVTKTDYQLNTQPTETLADMTASGSYDELGRLKNKKRHNGADTEQFDYNIRNWPTKITSGEFEENLYYNTTPSNSIQTYPCYNGNISYSSWTYNGGTRGYQYNYDGLNRYTGGYAFINNVMQMDYQYSESFNYDKMGNITLLNRFTAEDISDALTLQYNGNQLKNVTDNGIQQSIYGLKDYQNLSTTTSDEFAYDANGNMTKDLDRDIVTIWYNLLNLPEVIQFRNGNQIKNLYNASGQKLGTEYFAKLVGIVLPIDKDTVCSWTYASGLVNQKGTIYIDNKEYNTLNGNVALTALSRVHNAEGYVENITSTPNYYYFRKDHLGNNREVWLANSDTTIQRTQYYPSGLPWAESEGQEVQNKKYNGKEWIEMHGLDEYDSQARMYYPAIMRTTTLDPLAEKYYSMSPYAWCGNNPVNRIDPDGMDWFENQKTGAMYYNSTYGQDDVGKQGMSGEGWSWLGANGMFMKDSKDFENSDVAILGKNGGNFGTDLVWDGKGFKSIAYNTLSMDSKTATKVLSGLGYEQKPLVANVHTINNTYTHPDGEIQITISDPSNRDEFEKVFLWTYAKKESIPTFDVISNYRRIKDGFDPNIMMIKNESWQKRRYNYNQTKNNNILEKRGFLFDRTIDIIELIYEKNYRKK